ncbi:hypothetical protein ACHAQJ_007350 [Trichoderma viride]
MRLLTSISIGAFAGAVTSAARPDAQAVHGKEAGEHVELVPTATVALELRNAATTMVSPPTFQVTLCPEPAGFFAALEIESDLTYGCRPGTVCSPVKPAGCNFWPGPPPDEFRCQPEECIPAPPVETVVWKDGETGYYPPQFGYFNLNPHDFGLSYDIFEFEVVRKIQNGRTSTFTTGNWESQTSLTDGPISTGLPGYKKRGYSPFKQQARQKTHMNGKRDSAPSNFAKRDLLSKYNLTTALIALPGSTTSQSPK